jgi:hypothetical protein
MLINPAFVETCAETPEKLLMLVLHELHHVLLGHTRLFERSTPARNLVFDAVINSMLCRMFPHEEHWAMFRDYYKDDGFPECLLRPPRHWKPERVAAVPPGLADRGERIQSAYQALYSETGADYYDLFEVLSSALGQGEVGVALLGNHKGELPELQGAGVLFGAVREIVERWPQPPNPIRGRSLAETLSNTTVRPETRPTDRGALEQLIRRVAESRAGSRKRTPGGGMITAYTPSAPPDRRSVVLSALGVPNLLHATELAWNRAGGDITPVHVYVDVSGSVHALRPILYGAIASCRDLVEPTVHLFSTVVHDLPLRSFLSGECVTTGGTDIACVAGHIAKRRIRRAVILTDGWVGKPRGAHAQALRACKLGVALTPGSAQREDLKGFTNYWTQLKGEE